MATSGLGLLSALWALPGVVLAARPQLEQGIHLGVQAATQRLGRRAADAGGVWRRSDGKVPVWVWWDYASGHREAGYVDACRWALNQFAPASTFVVRYVNSSNIRQWLPDWPEECSRVYPQAVSDAVRAGLLSKHGGIYVDSDMLLAAPLSDVADKLKDHDMVSYTFWGQDCWKGTFSSNFMAGKPDNALHRRWYEEIKRQLKNKCTGKKDEVCCYDSTGALRKECHVPWAGIGEKIGHRTLQKVLSMPSSKFNVFCFNEDKHEGFAPCYGCFWASIPAGKGLNDASCEPAGDDLKCKDCNIKDFFSRRAYHLFSSVMPEPVKKVSLQELRAGPWVFSRLLQKGASAVPWNVSISSS